MSEVEYHPIAIIGSGPAGYTAAVYASRAGLNPILFEGRDFGGTLMKTTRVENYPGFPGGVGGPDLVMMMREQVEELDTRIVSEDVTSLVLSGPEKFIVAGGREYTADAVVLAMGSAFRLLGLPEEEELSGTAFFYCATCDGFPFQGKDVVVVGGGDSAMEEALFLAGLASTVTIVHRREGLRASAVMVARARSVANIQWKLDTAVEAVAPEPADPSRYRLTLRSASDDSESSLVADGVFVAVGHDPRSALIAGEVSTDEDGYVLTSHGSTQTNIEGVFAAGDLVDRTYRQAVTAAGSGCAAALDAVRHLSAVNVLSPL